MASFKRSIAWLCLAVPFGVLAAEPEQGTEVTRDAVAALKASPGQKNAEIQEVRATEKNVACIDYWLRDAQGARQPAHAVVQGNEVLVSTSGDERFEKMWSEHCLGPRGGGTPGPQ